MRGSNLAPPVLERQITYDQFESASELIPDPEKPGQTKRISVTRHKTYTMDLATFMVTFKKALAEHVQHMFRYRWQAAQLGDKLKMLLKPNHIAIGMDFSENYTILEPVEVQSLHWTKEQMVVLVFVVYRVVPSKAPENDGSTAAAQQTDDEPTVEMEHYYFVSKQTKKGCEFVNTCILKLLNFLEKEGRVTDVIHFISDGAAGDFKSNHAMLDRAMLWMSTSADGRRITCTVNFMESGHGKGPWDAAGAWLKNLLHTLATRSRIASDNANSAEDSNPNTPPTVTPHVIRTPEEVADLVNTHYSKPSTNYNRERMLARRHCFVIGEDEVNYKLTSRAMPDIKGLREMHQFDCPGGSHKGVDDLRVGYRRLSCYCKPCLDRNFTQCINKHIVGEFKYVQMRPANDATASVLEEYRKQVSGWEQPVNYGTIVTPAAETYPQDTDPDNCWVAVEHADENYSEYSFYLMWVNDGPTLLKSQRIDGYNSRFSRGTTVLSGRYLRLAEDDSGNMLPESHGSYTLDHLQAMVDVKSVVYSGFNVRIVPQGTVVVYQFSEDTRREIQERLYFQLH